jgi:hypothetical protein
MLIPHQLFFEHKKSLGAPKNPHPEELYTPTALFPKLSQFNINNNSVDHSDDMTISDPTDEDSTSSDSCSFDSKDPRILEALVAITSSEETNVDDIHQDDGNARISGRVRKRSQFLDEYLDDKQEKQQNKIKSEQLKKDRLNIIEQQKIQRLKNSDQLKMERFKKHKEAQLTKNLTEKQKETKKRKNGINNPKYNPDNNKKKKLSTTLFIISNVPIVQPSIV